jgi:hypothetical protein
MLCAGRNAFDGYTPSVPEGERLDFGSGRFLQLEAQGLAAAGTAAFVLVAGGLGERLGYQGAPTTHDVVFDGGARGRWHCCYDLIGNMMMMMMMMMICGVCLCEDAAAGVARPLLLHRFLAWLLAVPDLQPLFHQQIYAVIN